MNSNKNLLTNKKLLSNLLPFALIAAMFAIVSTEVQAQANLPKAIAAHIKRVREDAVEYKKARKIVYGDLDGDGTKDAAVQYTLEGAGGSNSWGQNLVVFLNKKGVYKMAADETVGGKFSRSFTLQKITGKKIIGAAETCPADEPQGMCKNPANKQVEFILSNGKLEEK